MDYPFIIIPILTGIFTQLIKLLLSIIKHRKIELKYLFTPGHMPSSHTSFVVSLATIVGFYYGISSIEFAISACFAYVVIYDAMNIRIHIGHNGEAINKLVKELNLDNGYPRLKERVGHLPEEVFVGAVLGFLFSMFLVMFL
ncbi:MAG: divergent PAP2 family protein [Candidatus Pacebacteria bacterium]|nr:divergent PAP2 family protein [Candidatus Paceibacterota bacterium]